MNLTWIRSWWLDLEPSEEQAHIEPDLVEEQAVEEAPTGRHLLKTLPSLSISLLTKSLDLLHPFEGHLSSLNPSFSVEDE